MAGYECPEVNSVGQQCNYDNRHSVNHTHFFRLPDGTSSWVEWKTKAPEQPCTQAWHGGLKWAILHECVRTEANHRVHKNAADDLHWTGKLTEQQEKQAATLREW